MSERFFTIPDITGAILDAVQIETLMPPQSAAGISSDFLQGTLHRLALKRRKEKSTHWLEAYPRGVRITLEPDQVKDILDDLNTMVSQNLKYSKLVDLPLNPNILNKASELLFRDPNAPCFRAGSD